MKNIHILPTDKPSRLHLGNSGLVLCDLMFNSNSINGQHIYITSDEEIREGDWCIDVISNYLYRAGITLKRKFKNKKKIILTTDQDLDGVQAIDDEFLEWFVKNPSCEKVEVKEKQHFESDKSKRENPLNGVYYLYKIIIPKEEPKQDLEKEMFELEQELDIPSHLRWYNSKTKQERSYSEEEVIKIVEKSRETGLTAQYLLLALNNLKNK